MGTHRGAPLQMIEVAVASLGLVCQPARKSAVWSPLRCSMFGIFSGYRRYIKTVGDCLRLLFVDFPPGTLAKLEGALAIDAITAAMFKGKSMDAKQCAVMIARTLVGIFFSRLPDEERWTTAAAFDARDLLHPVIYGLASMENTARQLTDDMHGRLLLSEAAGALRGMSREEIDDWWGRGEVERIVER